MKSLSYNDIQIINMGNNKLRMVTHLEVNENQIDKVAKVIKSL